MAGSPPIKDTIQAIIRSMMDRVMERVLETDPFQAEKHRAAKPLYAALVPDEIFKGSHFERRFVTPFGTVWEQLAVAVAQQGLGYAQVGRSVAGVVPEGRLSRISALINRLEHQDADARARGEARIRPDWKTELDYVLEAGGELIPVTVMCDVYAEDTSANERYAFELKAPLPNSDQTKVSKEKLLKLYAMEPRLIEHACYALPYNPYGKREDYRWSHPARWFNMREDKVVLIGEEFWEKIGGPGTYQALISAVNDIAPHYKARIYREFLGIEPPDDSQVDLK
jgi:hypothetical protein